MSKSKYGLVVDVTSSLILPKKYSIGPTSYDVQTSGTVPASQIRWTGTNWGSTNPNVVATVLAIRDTYIPSLSGDSHPTISNCLANYVKGHSGTPVRQGQSCSGTEYNEPACVCGLVQGKGYSQRVVNTTFVYNNLSPNTTGKLKGSFDSSGTEFDLQTVAANPIEYAGKVDLNQSHPYEQDNLDLFSYYTQKGVSVTNFREHELNYTGSLILTISYVNNQYGTSKNYSYNFGVYLVYNFTQSFDARCCTNIGMTKLRDYCASKEDIGCSDFMNTFCAQSSGQSPTPQSTWTNPLCGCYAPYIQTEVINKNPQFKKWLDDNSMQLPAPCSGSCERTKAYIPDNLGDCSMVICQQDLNEYGKELNNQKIKQSQNCGNNTSGNGGNGSGSNKTLFIVLGVGVGVLFLVVLITAFFLLK